jgi:site-specific DNA-cytosine methylase
MLLSRDYVKIGEAAKILGVTEQTLRNWHSRGKLVPVRHPINGYRMYRVADVHAVLREVEPQATLPFEAIAGSTLSEAKVTEDTLPPCHWAPGVALDPKHRPQHWDAPATTVRRDWRKFPQEAHVLDSAGQKYRRFAVDEIAILQGFRPSVTYLEGLTDRQRIAALGDAVPPPLARAIVMGIDRRHIWQNRTVIEICAGIGGLAEGGASIGLEHLALIDQDEICGRFLRNERHWNPDRVIISDLRAVDFSSYRGKIGLLSGGPPCQPWSRSGFGLGHDDKRDLLGQIHETVADIQPEVFLFENVPGLASLQNEPYLRALLERLRYPAPALRYGVLAAVLNAADFGVPQIRERIFILGVRDAPASEASRCFDAVEELQTHQRSSGSRTSLPNWRTVGSALASQKDPGGWRRWIGQ